MRQIFLFLVLSLTGVAAFAQTKDACLDPLPPTFDAWVDCRLRASVAAKQAQLVAKQTQQDPTKQSDSPAIASSSTSLVDHTSLADFVTGALNVSGFGNGASQTPSGSTTVSAYTIYSAIQGQNPLDAAFYDSHSDWRRLTFTAGTNSAVTGNGNTGATSGSDATATSSSRVVGASFLIINRRDLSVKSNRTQIENAANAAGGFAQIEAAIRGELILVLLPAYRLTKNSPIAADEATDKEEAAKPANLAAIERQAGVASAINAIFEAHASDYAVFAKKVKERVSAIQNAPQLSISGEATLADSSTTPSDYRAQLAFETGVPKYFNFTANGSFDYMNSRKVGADTRGGRLAVDFQHLFASDKLEKSSRKPVSLDFSGEGDWFQSFNPSYVGQLKLTIPLVSGVDLPLSFSYASSANLLHEAHTVGKFGLTFDLSRIASALTKQK